MLSEWRGRVASVKARNFLTPAIEEKGAYVRYGTIIVGGPIRAYIEGRNPQRIRDQGENSAGGINARISELMFILVPEHLRVGRSTSKS